MTNHLLEQLKERPVPQKDLSADELQRLQMDEAYDFAEMVACQQSDPELTEEAVH